MKVKQFARDWSLIFFGSLAAFLISTIIGANLGNWFVNISQNLESKIARTFLGIVSLDIVKVVGLLIAAWFIGPQIRLSPFVVSAGLTLLTFGQEVAVMFLMQRASGLWTDPLIVLCRIIVVMFLIFVVARFVKWRQQDSL